MSNKGKKHHAGFVNIIGNPNVGKSTLMNALVGERMSIITNKPQTTRHRIIGIWNDDNHQIVFSDTPGIIDDPSYKMQERMNAFVSTTFQDADVMMWVIDVKEPIVSEEHPFIGRLNRLEVPVFIVLNKIDLSNQEELVNLVESWQKMVPKAVILPISALERFGVDALLNMLKKELPEAPAYYPKDQLTDRPERFFVTEIIREKILLQFYQEIPYSVEVGIESFKVGEKITKIRALIYAMRPTQKSIIIGKGGSSIKRLGIDARKDIEEFLQTRVHLELFVKVKEGWRDDEKSLKGFGYE